MEPIISPWFIYALGIVDSIRGVAGGGTFLFGVLVVIGAFVVSFGLMPPREMDLVDGAKKVLCFTVPLFVLFLSIRVLTPSSKILTAMYAASIATPDNISSVVGAGKSFKDEVKQDIIDLMEHGLGKVTDEESQ